MKVSYQWLQDYFANPSTSSGQAPLPPASELEEVIALHAFEIDGIDSVGEDCVIDVDVLPNRSSDAFSHRGIAKELSAILNVPLKADPFTDLPKVETDANVRTSEHASLTIEVPEICRRSLKRLAVGVKVGESPKWLKKRLETLGQKPINNVVDITNYIMLDLGQPVHAFDFDKLKGEKKHITIRRAKAGERIAGLDGGEYELTETIPVIADESGPMDIAGIKGGAHTAIDENTTRVLLSASSFDPVVVRKASRALKLRTDASARFENDVPQELAPIAMEHFSAMLADICGATIATDVLDDYPRKQHIPRVTVTAQQATALLGMEITDAVVEDVLTRLGLPFEKSGETFTVTPPFARTDIHITEDLIEEVGRIHGYSHLASTVPVADTPPHINKRRYYEDSVRDVLVGQGFSEVYTYSLRPSGKVELENPMTRERAFLRESLEDALRESLTLNERNKPLLGLDRIKIFEIGTVFKKDTEYLALGVAVSGKKADAIVKETLEVLANEFGAAISYTVKSGFVECNLSELIEKLPEPNEPHEYPLPETFVDYKPFSAYPYVLRDIAAWMPAETDVTEIEKTIYSNAGEYLQRVDLFDEFTPGAGHEHEGKASRAFHLVFQSHERTLTDAEVNTAMQKVEAAFAEKGWEVR